jgi:hypothetical protein
VLTLLLRTGKQRFLFLTWHLSYYSERWSKSSIFSKWGKKGRTDRDSDCTNRYWLCKQISTVQTDIDCTNRYRLYKHISTVQTYIDRTNRYRLYKHISTAQTDIDCTNRYRLYKQISTVQTYIDCTNKYRLYKHISTVQRDIDCTNRYRLYKQISVICEIDIHCVVINQFMAMIKHLRSKYMSNWIVTCIIKSLVRKSSWKVNFTDLWRNMFYCVVYLASYSE